MLQGQEKGWWGDHCPAPYPLSLHLLMKEQPVQTHACVETKTFSTGFQRSVDASTFHVLGINRLLKTLMAFLILSETMLSSGHCSLICTCTCPHLDPYESSSMSTSFRQHNRHCPEGYQQLVICEGASSTGCVLTM